MPTATLRPDATITAGTVTGAASTHAATSDDTDVSYVTTSTEIAAGLSSFTIPTGAVTRSVRVRARAKDGGSLNADLYGAVYITTGVLADVHRVQTPVFAEMFGAYISCNLTQTDVNNLKIRLASLNAKPVNISEAYVDVDYALEPTATITYPTGVPTINTTTSPVVTWTHTPGTDGGPQSRYQLRVFTSAQYAAAGFNPATSASTFDTGETLGAGTAASVGPLSDSTYRAYLRTAQTINGVPHWSPWVYAQFVMDVPTPVIDTLLVAPDDTNGRIRISIALDTGGLDWDYLTVERTLDDETWLPVRGATRTNPPGDSWIGYDYEAPPALDIRYRARGITTVAGIDSAGDWAVSSTTSWTTDQIWIKALYATALNIHFDCLLERPKVDYPRQQGINPVIGSQSPVVVSDVLGLRTGALQLATQNAQQRRDLLSVLNEAVVLVQIPESLDVASMYCATGSVQAQQPYVTTGEMWWTIQFTEVTQPVDDGSQILIQGLTWGDLATTGETWADLAVLGTTWGDYL